MRKNKRKLLNGFQGIGLEPIRIEVFKWGEREREFVIDFSIEIDKFIGTSNESYEEEEVDDMKSYDKYNKDKMNFTYKKNNRKMNATIVYDVESESLVDVFIKDIFYNFNHSEYLLNSENFLKASSYAERLENKKIVEIFSEEEGQKFLRRAMRELEEEMSVKKEWIEKEMAERVEKMLANL